MKPMLMINALLCAAAGNGPVRQDGAPLSVDEVLHHVREATGYEKLGQHPGGVLAEGPANVLGRDVQMSFVFDGKGRVARRFTGAVPVASGCNGAECWQLEFSGQPRLLELGERAEEVIIGAAVTGTWLGADTSLRFALDESAAAPDRVVLSFEHSGGYETGLVEIDRQTWLPRRWEVRCGHRQELNFDGVVEFDGFKLPAKVTHTTDHGLVMTWQFDRVGAAPSGERGVFDAPSPPTGDIRFDATTPAELVVERAPTGHLLVKPLLNGQDVGWFIFDTGAGSTVLTHERVEQVGAEKLGSVQAMGVGGSMEAPIIRVGSLQIGSVTLQPATMIDLDFGFLTGAMGRPIGGVLGYDVLSRCILEIDPAEGKIALHDPATYKWEQAPCGTLHFLERVPAIEASFEGHQGLLRLDTGAGGALAFHYPAVERFKLLDNRETSASLSGGVGGMVAMRSGRLARLELCGHRLEDLECGFATEARGAYNDPYAAGSIGGDVLRRFTIVLDYPKRQIALRQRDGG